MMKKNVAVDCGCEQQKFGGSQIFFYERHLSPKVKGGANLSRIELLVYLS